MYVRIDKYSCVDVKYYMKTKIKNTKLFVDVVGG